MSASHDPHAEPEVYGLMAEFDEPRGPARGDAERAYERGYRMMEAYTPFPVDGLAEAIGFHRNRMPADRAASAACSAGLAGYFMQWYSAVDRLPDQRRRPAAP